MTLPLQRVSSEIEKRPVELEPLVALSDAFLLVLLILSALSFTGEAYAQFTDAHSYDNTPVGTREIELSYATVHANASIDDSLVIAGAQLTLQQGTIDYTHYLSLLHRVMWVQAGVPIASLGGSLTGTTVQRSVTGGGDSSYSLALLLRGGPALSAAQFENYQPTTTLGVSVTVTAPTGSYNPDTILNLGEDRWTLKPEIALSHPFGLRKKWQVDAYTNACFYTRNTSYRGREILTQEPLPGVEGHISYAPNDKVWLSADTRYSFRGTTFVNDVDQDNSQRNFFLGSEVNININTRNSLLFEVAKAIVHHNGPALVGFAVKYQYTWGSGYK